MDFFEEMHVHDVKIAKEPVQSEQCGSAVGNNSAAAAAAALLEHLEEDEEMFEDALDNLTLDSVKTADECDIEGLCCDVSSEHGVDTLQPSGSKLQDDSDELLHGETAANAGLATSGPSECVSDSGHDGLCEDEVTSEAASEPVIVDEEVLREREALLTDEEKQVFYLDLCSISVTLFGLSFVGCLLVLTISTYVC